MKRLLTRLQESGAIRVEFQPILRVRPDGAQGSRVDLRSKSRDGQGDMGTNAARIRAFVGQLEQGAGGPPA